MLFISRRVMMTLEEDGERYNAVGYGVVDTDDGIEELWDEDHLGMAINTHNLKIAGAPEEYKLGDIMRPYQSPDSLSSLQVKLKMVRQIEVTVYKGSITNIVWNARKLQSPVSIRLSDFGSQCDDFILYGRYPQSGYPVTFVFDDKLTDIKSMSFRLETAELDYGTITRFLGGKGWAELGIRYDLRELTSDSLAEIVYSQVLKYNCAEDSILDSVARKKRMLSKFMAVYMVRDN